MYIVIRDRMFAIRIAQAKQASSSQLDRIEKLKSGNAKKKKIEENSCVASIYAATSLCTQRDTQNVQTITLMKEIDSNEICLTFHFAHSWHANCEQRIF